MIFIVITFLKNQSYGKKSNITASSQEVKAFSQNKETSRSQKGNAKEKVSKQKAFIIAHYKSPRNRAFIVGLTRLCGGAILIE